MRPTSSTPCAPRSGKRNGGLAKVHPADLGAHSIRALMRSRRRRPGRGRRRRVRLRRHDRPAGGRHRAHVLARCRLPDEVPGTTVDRQCGSSQQAVHFAAAGGDVGHDRSRRRGRRAEHERDPDQRGDARRRAVRLRRPRSRDRRAGKRATARKRCRSSAAAEMIAEKWNITPRRHGSVRGRVARACVRARRPRAASTSEIVPLDGLDHDEGPREPESRQDPLAADARRRRPAHGRGVVADLRRLGRDADRERGRRARRTG